MRETWLELDSALKERLRATLEDVERRLTEAELRKLDDQGRACHRILEAELERSQERLAELDRDPESSLAEIADAFRRISVFRSHLEELDELLAALHQRARQVRTLWLLTAGSPRVAAPATAAQPSQPTPSPSPSKLWGSSPRTAKPETGT
jgi:DNA repair exonuclease SbcCD ATPase subunit